MSKVKAEIKKVFKFLFTEESNSSITGERIIVFVRWLIILFILSLLILTTDISKHTVLAVLISVSIYNLLLSLILYSGFITSIFRVVQYFSVFIDELVLAGIFWLTGDVNNLIYPLFFFAIFGVSLRMESKDSYIVSVINTFSLPIILYMVSPSIMTMFKAGILGIASIVNLFSTRVIELNTIRLKRESRNTDIMFSISNVINSVIELEPLLEIAIYEIVNKLSAIAGIIALYDTEKDDFTYIASSGDLNIIGGYVSKSMLDDYIMSRVISEKKCIIMPDPDGRINTVDSWFETLNTVSFILYPFVCNENYIGVIGLFGRKDNKIFSSYYLNILKGITSQIITGINRAFLYEDLLYNRSIQRELLSKIETAYDDERRKIAGEVHDMASGVMYELITAINDFSKRAKGLTRDNQQLLTHIKELIVDYHNQLRLFLSRLRPTVLDDFGLPYAIMDLLGHYKQHHNLNIEFINSYDDYPLTYEQKDFLYKVTNEAIVNIIKHAQANKITVTLGMENNNIVLSVADNGKGFNPANKYKNKYGLLYIRERTTMLKGSLNIDSKENMGTKITVTLPLQEMEQL
ncbi:MAG: GAF domain-containing sensor histidine kinase [bacterium]